MTASIQDRDAEGDIYEYMSPKIATAGRNGQLRTPRHIIQLMAKMLYTLAVVVVLLAGFELLATSNCLFSFSDTFVILGIVMIVIDKALEIAFFGSQSEKADAAYTAGGSADASTIVRRTVGTGALDTALLVVTIAAMVTKWCI